jgi:FtsP/CotA-like multicopper oxidase with cupredoxin domain
MRIGPTFLALGTLSLCLAAAAFAKPPPFENPPSLESVGGVLEVTLDAGPSEIQISNKRVTSNVYNGLYVPPVLRLGLGDTLLVETINNTSDLQLNFHSHGIITSPVPPGDNVVSVKVMPGEDFDTSITIDEANSSGMYWYHTHVHGFVNDGISNGMSSALIVGDILASFPQLEGITEQVMLLKDMKIEKNAPAEDPDPAGKTRRTINGLFEPELTIAPGELQFWRIANVGANIFYDLTMKGVTFNVLAVDGNLQNQHTETDELVMPPGRRFEVLVRGPDKPGTYKLETNKFDTGPDGDAYPGQRMATLKVSKTPVAKPIPLPTSGFASLENLSMLPITGNGGQPRTIVFDDTDDPDVFVIDGDVYDETVVNTTVQLGTLEEWKIQNASGEFHVFHIHQGDFQVISIDGVAQPFTGYQDTVNLPVATDSGPGEVVIRIRFDPPIIVGEYVYHCHIVQHEDKGMMANLVVEDAAAALLESEEPPDLIAQVLTPIPSSYWCQ